MTIVVYVTDARGQYIQSVLNISALPLGAMAPLRYALKWVDPDLVASIRQKQDLVGSDLVLCHLAGNSGDLHGAVVYPIRRAKVGKLELVGQYLVIQAELGSFIGGYANQAMFNQVGADSPLEVGPRAGHFIDVVSSPVLAEELYSSEIEGWQSTVDGLSMAGSLTGAHFCFLESISDAKHGAIQPFDSDGNYLLRADREYGILVHTMSRSQASVLADLFTVHISSSVGTLIDTPDVPAGLRFNNRTVLFRAMSDRRTRGTISLRGSGGLVGPNIEISAKVQVSKTKTVLRKAPIALGASVAASAALLPEDVPLYVKIGMVALGSIAVSVSRNN
jgi:hypothetical protein